MSPLSHPSSPVHIGKLSNMSSINAMTGPIYELHPSDHKDFIGFMTDFRCKPLEGTEFSLLRRATQGTLRELWLLIEHPAWVDGPRVSESLTSNANRVFDILSLALSTGCVEAYQIVEDLNCLELFAKYRRPMQTSAMVSSYVTGLKALPSSIREVYITHLYEPRNLHIAILSLFEWWPYTHPHDIGVADLIQLRSDDLSWDECRRWLKYVSEWAKEDKRLCLPTFNARRLGEKWQWRVLRMYLADSDDLEMEPIPPDANWSGTLKLQEAIQSLDEFFAKKQAENDDDDSLVIPPSPTLPSMSLVTPSEPLTAST
ncbi:hypothetical protein BT96DRAFT_1044447 [Gymnopus androsaceus JB14]|uniref:Uncharacterized protein n=1 Tax=Gymnopus androsaceus JB14 TaxID=1447944 RepID=A0A6A4HAS3_9AGAR|nr:hypothetical protein BT96DRAFT_1044447 [Gymnopus androsaceus JB14]